MLGVYDYTVILTYLSAASAVTGIYITQLGSGHPYTGCLFLMLCGFLDAFDGKVARTKKNRTDFECKFGIQIDSLTDLLAFGVLPACIASSLLQNMDVINFFNHQITKPLAANIFTVFYYLSTALYVLAALIRLAHFNVVEEERQAQETCNRTFYQGVPVTTSAILFPFILLVQYLTEVDISVIYFVGISILGLLFIIDIKIPKLKTKQIIVMSIFALFATLLILTKVIVRG